jgi:hypothetical protein|tara:strand:+ start:282 stop:614 length:333 start_codon:yes stop_codon:yes gene_type:complete
MANTFKNKTSQAIGTVTNRIGNYTVASSTQTTIIGLTIANITGTTIYVDCNHSDGATNTALVKTAPIPSGGSLIVVGGDQKVVLETGDGIFVTSDTASSADVVMSILEIT